MIDKLPTTSTSPRKQAPSDAPGLVRLLDDCGRTAAEGRELLGAVYRADEQLRARWSRLHARLVDLEVRATGAANATRDTRRQRQLDELAGALIALRGAVDADARLRFVPEAAPPVVAAGDHMVLVRCDDVLAAILAIETRSM